jgi:hypothetical protein
MRSRRKENTMSEVELTERSHDELQYLDNVLADVGTSKATRGGLLKKAAIAAAGVGVFGQASAALGAVSRAGADTVATVTTTAVTAEALAVSILTTAVKKLPGTPAAQFKPVLQAANQAEYDHYTVLSSLGAKPLTTHFWVPDALLGPNNKNLFASIELAETVFINAYLTGITVFARAKQDKLARYAGEILGVEAEHRTLARYAESVLAGKKLTRHTVPNEKAFETYTIQSMSAAVAALEKVGIGFGKQTSAPGQFVDFPGNPSKNGTGFYEIAPKPA